MRWKKMMKKRKYSSKYIKHYIFLGISISMVILPFLWVLISSLKTKSQFMVDPYGLPDPVMYENYADAFQSINMPNLFKNSIFISLTSVLGALLVASAAAFVLARCSFKINKWIYSFFLIGMMIPLNAAIIPLFITLKNVKLTNTYAGIIIPYIAFQIPMGIFLLTNYIKTIPNELEEAAIIDGCSVVQLFIKVIVPLSKPIFATFSIITFMSLWNEFLFALVFLTGEEFQTVPLGLASFRGQYDTNTTVMLAGTVIAMIPTLIIYVLLRDNIVKGMTAGAVKG